MITHPSKDLHVRPGRVVRCARPLPSLVAAVAACAVTLSAPAQAYVGPGAGLGVIGTLFGIVAAILLAMFGLLWYPLKRAFAKKGATTGSASSATSTPAVAHQPVDAKANVEATDRAAERRAETNDGVAAQRDDRPSP